MLIGYARVSTIDQNTALQMDALKAAGCEKVFTEKASGSHRDRPQLLAALDYLRKGDTLVVWGCKPKPAKFPACGLLPLNRCQDGVASRNGKNSTLRISERA